MPNMDLDMFGWDKGSKCLSIEMSTIQGNDGFQGNSVMVQGKKLAQPVEFSNPEPHVDRENEVTHWKLQPRDAAMALTGLHMIIFND